MNIILSDPRQGKAYSKKTEEAVFAGRKIGDTVELAVIGLDGYKAVITGGSDKDGFPMKPTLEGQARKKLLMKEGIGIRRKRKGGRRRKRVRGCVVAQDIHQLNLKITEYGPAKLSDVFKKAAGGEKEKEKTVKEKALEQKLLSAEEGKKPGAGKEEQKKGEKGKLESGKGAGEEEKKEEGQGEKEEGKPAEKKEREEPAEKGAKEDKEERLK